TCIKDGMLFKQTSSFNRWKKRYFKLKGRRLYYAKDRKSALFNEIDISNLSVAECSTRNINHSFQMKPRHVCLSLLSSLRSAGLETLSTNMALFHCIRYHLCLSIEAVGAEERSLICMLEITVGFVTPSLNCMLLGVLGHAEHANRCFKFYVMLQVQTDAGSSMPR
ncbi:diacylglycerol kinase delta isoform X10, partial [Biomphalaria glabrata]